MFIPSIPENSLTQEIKEVVRLSEKLCEEHDFCFPPPATEAEIALQEQEINAKIPDSYKDWLRFSNGVQLNGLLVKFLGVKALGKGTQFVSGEYVVIARVIGDGEFLCFSKETGDIVWEDHGNIKKYGTFNSFLRRFIIPSLRVDAGEGD